MQDVPTEGPRSPCTSVFPFRTNTSTYDFIGTKGPEALYSDLPQCLPDPKGPLVKVQQTNTPDATSAWNRSGEEEMESTSTVVLLRLDEDNEQKEGSGHRCRVPPSDPGLQSRTLVFAG